MVTRAPSPCSADSSSEASAKEDATQGKPTDDARLTEIERKFNTGDVLSRTEAQAVFAALRASQENERIAAEGQVVAVDVGAKHAERRMAADDRAEAAERERDDYKRKLVELSVDDLTRLRAENDALTIQRLERERDALMRERDSFEEHRSKEAWVSLYAERDALRGALNTYGKHHQGCDMYRSFKRETGRCYCGLSDALAPRPPVKEE